MTNQQPPVNAARSLLSTTIATALLVLLMAVFFAGGWIGIDFGTHWDENDHVTNVHHSLETRLLLPTGAYSHRTDFLGHGFYGYPSVLYWIGMASIVPEVSRDWDAAGGQAAYEFAHSKDFLLRFRMACLAISSLTLLWVFLGTRKLTRSNWPALTAVMFIVGSWELNYHARWVATDMLVVQFASLSFYFCACAIAAERTTVRWLVMAAVAAGVATGTKYPAGALILMVWTTAVVVWWRQHSWRRITHWLRLGVQCAALLVAQLAAFVVTTPGAVLQPWHFIHWIHHNRQHYGVAGHFGYTVYSSAEHARLMAEYLGYYLFSQHMPLAVATVALSAIGLVTLLVRRQYGAWLLLTMMPAAYFIYFSQQRAMVVRNILILAPFMAILAGIGVSGVVGCIRSRGWRYVPVIAMLVMVGISIAGVLKAAQSIRTASDTTPYLHQLLQFIESHPDRQFYGLPSVMEQFAAAQIKLPANLKTTDLEHADYIVADRNCPDRIRWLANHPAAYFKWFGPGDVNPRYYPTWLAANHILVIPKAWAGIVPNDRLQDDLRIIQLTTNAPNGFVLDDYLDLGAGGSAATQPSSISLPSTFEVVQGHSFTYPVLSPDMQRSASVVYDRELVRIRINNLSREHVYKIGVSWVDIFTFDRQQQIELAVPETAHGHIVRPLIDLPEFRGNARDPAQHAVDWILDIPEELRNSDSVDIIIRGVSRPNVAASEVWLYKSVSSSTP